MNIDFFRQIKQNLNEYKTDYPNNINMQRDEWTFNYWILDKLYSVDEETIFDQIIDVHDKGIDCYHFDDDNNTLYIMQNKFYDPDLTSELNCDYLQDLSVLPLNLLHNGKYNHCKELQDIYNRLKRRSQYNIIFTVYITKELEDSEKGKFFRAFNINENIPNVKFEIKDLNDIYHMYYSDYSDGISKKMDYDLTFKTNKLMLDMNDDEIDVPIHAKYIMVPIIQFYNMMEQAKKEGYNLFDENIRDYLGSNGKINSKIKETLKDENDRKYFVYYNNGVTVVCSKVSKSTENVNNNERLLIKDPKIVNGCQTVSTIHEVLKEYYYLNENLDCFKDVFVMAKFLDSSSIEINQEEITKNIVQRNNSQNSIDISIFNIRKKELVRIQEEFTKKGFLLMIKQSDRVTFTNTYKGNKFEELKNSASDIILKYGLKYDKLSQFLIPLDKFLQVVYCFSKDAYYAYTRKSKVVKDVKTHNEIVDYIKENGTLDDYLDLYLLYARAEQDRKSQKYGDDRTPIPLYLIDFFARFECDSRNISKISSVLDNSQKIDDMIKKYSNFTRSYTKMYNQRNSVDYNKMIKQKIDENILVDVNSMISNIIY